MRCTRRSATVALAAALFGLAAASAAAAADFGEKVQVHGYGNWAYGKTDGNAYMNGTDEGNYDKLEFSLAVAAAPSPNVSVQAQIFVENDEEGAGASVDYAFAEYAFSDLARFRIGAVKQPFGIFTEIFDVGTVYPFVSLAQGIYGPAGFVSEHYVGAGLTGRTVVGSGWNLQYDLYGGEMESALSTPWAETGEDEGEADIMDMVGGRFVLTTPGMAANCGVSAYTGSEDARSEAGEVESHRQTAVGAHVEWFQGPATVRAEYAYKDDEVTTANAAYAEAAWRFTPHWQVAARYDWSKTDLEDGADVDGELLKHQDIGFAVDYFFSRNMVLKFAYHRVDGNRFTAADDEDEAQDDTTNLYTAGVSFSF